MFCYFDKINNVGYYPIHKNASTTFSTLAQELNWSTTEDMELLPREVKIFAHIRDPIERHFSGTVEYITSNNFEYTLDDPKLEKMWVSALMDIHSYPITWVLGDIAKRIHWIPIVKDFDSTQATFDFLAKHSVYPSKIETKNKSDYRDLILKERLKSLHSKNDKYSSLTYFYEHDYKLFYKAMNEYLFAKTKWKELDE